MDNDEECLAFCHRNKSSLNKLVHPAFEALSVIAARDLPLSEFLVSVALFYHLTSHHAWHTCLTAYCLDLYL